MNEGHDSWYRIRADGLQESRVIADYVLNDLTIRCGLGILALVKPSETEDYWWAPSWLLSLNSDLRHNDAALNLSLSTAAALDVLLACLDPGPRSRLVELARQLQDST